MSEALRVWSDVSGSLEFVGCGLEFRMSGGLEFRGSNGSVDHDGYRFRGSNGHSEV